MQLSLLKSLNSRISLALILAITSIFLARCTQKEVAKDDAENEYQEAEESFKDEHYLQALEKYRDIKNRYPYSARATDAELRVADTYFAQESYIESESAYEIFKELHPTHPRIDYVQYQMALSFYNQIPDVSSRDLSAAFRAIDALETLQQKYPTSQYAPKANELIVAARKKLAEHEEYVADFYFQRKHYLSATYRYNALIQEFGRLGYDELALYRLGVSYMNIRMFSNARDALTRLVTEHPQSDYKSQAQSLLAELDKKSP